MESSELYKNFDAYLSKFKINLTLRYKISHGVLGTTKLFSEKDPQRIQKNREY